MPFKYCPVSACASRTEYTAKVPRFCASCGAEFAAAFGSISIPLAAPVRSAPVATRVLPSEKLNLPKRTLHARPAPEGVEDQEDSDGVRRTDILEEANQMAASINAADFGLIIKTDNSPTVKLGAFLKNPDGYNIGVRIAETVQAAPESSE